MTVQAEFPEPLAFLFEPARYKVAYGGRGGAKSWGFARSLLIQGASRKLRILCCREFQKSTADSVHALLADQAKALGLDAFYEVQKTRILGANGTEFGFEGLRHNVSSIKSYEGADVCWVEEARTVSKTSWDTLIPTIRKPGSEIWISFNPELSSDETYKRFVLNPPTGAVVREISYLDNPWCPAVLIQEAADLKVRDPDAYLTVWGGKCKVVLDGAIYANELRAAAASNRMAGKVPHIPGIPVHVFFDLGRADMTSMWFAQVVDNEFHLIDYYESRGRFFQHYIDQLFTRGKAPIVARRPEEGIEGLEARPEKPGGYEYGQIWLPHDGRHAVISAPRTVEQQLWKAKFTVRTVPNLSIAAGIDAARLIFGRCRFDEEACSDGLSCLRNYRYDVDQDTKEYSDKPLHDWASHGADAFRYFAIGIMEPKPKQTEDKRPADRYGRKRRAEETRESGWAA